MDMIDVYGNDQLGVFDEDLSILHTEDFGYDAEDNTLDILKGIFEEAFETLELKLEGDKDVAWEYAAELAGSVDVVCKDELGVEDSTMYFELLLAEYDLPSALELFEEEV